MLALRLPVEIEARLAALAKATGRSKSYYARKAILEQLPELELRARAAAPAEQSPDPADDPFGAFGEWESAADRKAYAGL